MGQLTSTILSKFFGKLPPRKPEKVLSAMPIGGNNPVSAEKEELGRLLYFDPILSGDNTISCAHCHHPDLGFTDNRALSMGRGGSGIGKDRKGGQVLRRVHPQSGILPIITFSFGMVVQRTWTSGFFPQI
ncbi:MAG: hypothetical protein CM1200mP10_03840 [Candidatus Neomarinimicrobiota bacterium]|nr:MAG: hypothetical protein CM1200mP10_03840 [Candidatus Neomarinimicrobiota bacterium]